MSAHRPRPEETGRSTRRILLDIFLMVTIPSAMIYVVSRLWH